MELQEKILLSQLKLDDEAAFTMLYNKYWFKLYRLVVDKIKSKEVAEEIVHDVFADFWLRRKNIEISISVEAYLAQAVRYAAYNYIKSSKNRDGFIAGMVDDLVKNELRYSNFQSEFAELNDSFISALNILPLRCRQVFTLSRLNQLSNKEISAEMSISVKTVENQITKALKILKVSLRDFTFLILLCSSL